ncbi:RING finger protein, partial [Smittium culicis]
MDSSKPAKIVAFKKFKKPSTLKKSNHDNNHSSEKEKNSSTGNILKRADNRWEDESDDYGEEIESEEKKQNKKIKSSVNTFSSKSTETGKSVTNFAVDLKIDKEQKLGNKADEDRMYMVLENSENYSRANEKVDNRDLNNDSERSKEYKGMSSYRTFAPIRYDEKKDNENITGKLNQSVSNKPKSRFGPIRASQNVRVTSVMDYQPDVCKDYKETGFCGYGDSCKFLHDRGDYKSGWQLEKEWEEMQANGGRREDTSLWKVDNSDDDASSSDDELPFACSICLKEFTTPISTRCNHYFCESCALKNYLKTPKCFICGAATGGMFKPATALIKKLKEKHE